jgi:protein O-GlcNAc transferase
MTILRPVHEAFARGDWASARAHGRDILLERPDVAAVHHAIGLSFCGEGAFAEALPYLLRARAIDADNPRWARDLGIVCGKLKRWSETVAVLGPMLHALDSDALALFLSAAVEAACPETALAELDQRRAAPLPGDPQFQCAYGVALAMAKRPADAEAVLLRCLAEHPDTADAHEALAFLYEDTKQAERALVHAEACVRLRPRSSHARIRLALAYSERGRCLEGRAERLLAEQIGLTQLEDHSVKVFVMLSDPHETADSILAAARAGFTSVQPQSPSLVHQSAHQPEPKPAHQPAGASRNRRLRVGYVSGECRSTPAWYFFRPFLPRHDRSSVEVFLYRCNALSDRVTATYEQWPEHWRDYSHLTDVELAAALRADDLDVVVDLSGHFIFNRLAVLAERVAPVQATFPNFPGTTGCPSVDYFFTDAWTSPDGTEGEYSERLHRLPCGYLKYAPPDEGPPVGRLPMRTRGAPTFGIFQRLSKFNDGVWDAVAAVLAATPGAHLLIQNGDRELDRPDSETSCRLRRELEMRGIGPRRMTLKGPLPYLEHLAVVTQVDVSLDTFPYAGQTTTCESMWMGVPVVTLTGGTHVNRVCGALLARAGHPEWVAESRDAYVEIATALVSDVDRLERIRRQLRRDVVDGGLTNGDELARALEAAYHSFAIGRP